MHAQTHTHMHCIINTYTLHTNRYESTGTLSINSPAKSHTAIFWTWTAYGDPEACNPMSYKQQRDKETDGSKMTKKLYVIYIQVML